MSDPYTQPYPGQPQPNQNPIPPAAPFASAPAAAAAPSQPKKKGPKVLTIIGVILIVLGTVVGVIGTVMTVNAFTKVAEMPIISAGDSRTLQLEANTEYGILMAPYGSANATVYDPDGDPVTVRSYTGAASVEYDDSQLAGVFTTNEAGPYELSLMSSNSMTNFMVIANPVGTIMNIGLGIVLISVGCFIGFVGVVCLIIGLIWRSRAKKAVVTTQV
ncbi:MAG: hypothetical protein LBL92_02255, partial [Propionibacteriaceae bacterium]|nr:hypothetical protein [Propionibacteriaceae bacterium]